MYTDLAALDRSYTAWESDRHSAVWEAMRSEFEVDDRVEMLNDRVGPNALASFVLAARACRYGMSRPLGHGQELPTLEAGCGQLLLAACWHGTGAAVGAQTFLHMSRYHYAQRHAIFPTCACTPPTRPDRVHPPALLGAEGRHPEQGVHGVHNAGASHRGLPCNGAPCQHVRYTEHVVHGLPYTLTSCYGLLAGSALLALPQCSTGVMRVCFTQSGVTGRAHLLRCGLRRPPSTGVSR